MGMGNNHAKRDKSKICGFRQNTKNNNSNSLMMKIVFGLRDLKKRYVFEIDAGKYSGFL